MKIFWAFPDISATFTWNLPCFTNKGGVWKNDFLPPGHKMGATTDAGHCWKWLGTPGYLNGVLGLIGPLLVGFLSIATVSGGLQASKADNLFSWNQQSHRNDMSKRIEADLKCVINLPEGFSVVKSPFKALTTPW